MVRHHAGGFRWEGVELLPYKEDGTHFKSITRQTIFKCEGSMPVEFRYFEIGEGGHSTLEKHEHEHAVMVIRGSGQVLVGDEVSELGTYDVVHIPGMTWHQFRATKGEPLGFLCIVNTERDKPQRPNAETVGEVTVSDDVKEFIRY